MDTRDDLLMSRFHEFLSDELREHAFDYGHAIWPNRAVLGDLAERFRLHIDRFRLPNGNIDDGGGVGSSRNGSYPGLGAWMSDSIYFPTPPGIDINILNQNYQQHPAYAQQQHLVIPMLNVELQPRLPDYERILLNSLRGNGGNSFLPGLVVSSDDGLGLGTVAYAEEQHLNILLLEAELQPRFGFSGLRSHGRVLDDFIDSGGRSFLPTFLHGSTPPEIPINILNQNNQDPGNAAHTQIIYNAWKEYIHQRTDSLGQPISVADAFIQLMGQGIGAVMSHTLTEAAYSSSNQSIVKAIDYGVISGVTLTLGGICLRGRWKTPSVVMTKTGTIATACGVVFGMASHLPPMAAWIFVPPLWLLIATAVALF